MRACLVWIKDLYLTMRPLHRHVGAALRGLIAAILVWAAVVTDAPVAAHELQPAIVDISVESNGELTISIATNLEAFLADIGPGHADSDDAPTAAIYNRLRALPPAGLLVEAQRADAILRAAVTLRVGDVQLPLQVADVTTDPVGSIALARQSVIKLQTTAPSGSQSLIWQSAPRLGDAVIRVSRTGEAAPYFTAYVVAGDKSDPVALSITARQSTIDVMRNYVVTGFDHIVPKGLDHILFVAGLFLLSARLKPLLTQVTCFTLAHSITLGLGAIGAVALPPTLVESLIAASIIFVGIENLFTDRLRPWRPALVFGFGLLHGLGFASVLGAFGLPEGQFLPALIAFNVGVELGQLLVVGACFVSVGLWFGRKSWYRPYIVRPASVAIAAIGCFWLAERSGLLL
ncbi:MAG: HupE/UreJ family protein [Alphaproteobacteria bacterium]